MLTKLQTLREEREDGFTLIELLVVILIIGILASIAIPVFLNQRKTANDGAVKSDVRNAAIVAQTAISDNSGAAKVFYDTATNKICAVAASATACPANSPEVKKSVGVTISVDTTSTPNQYIIRGWHENGKVYNTSANALVYNSSSGGLTN